MRRRFPYWFVAVLAAWLVYSVTWTWISLQRLYALTASVYDLGVYSQLGWRVYATPLSPGQWLGTALNLGGPIFLWPTTLGGDFTVLAAQSVALGSGGVLVYLIARQYALRSSIGFGLAAAYLMYFPLCGINFTDAHYEAYFIPLFLLGVWLFLRGSFLVSFVLFLLAGVVQFPLSVFPLFFGMQLLVPVVCSLAAGPAQAPGPKSGRRSLRSSILRAIARWKITECRSPIPGWYAFGLPLASLALLIGALLTHGLYEPNYNVARLVHASSIGLLPNLPTKLWTLFLLLAPLAFLPILSPRWLPYCAPFFALMFMVNYVEYTYPHIVLSWYTFFVVPFLLLATVDGVAKIQTQSTWVHTLLRWRRAASSSPAGSTGPPSPPREPPSPEEAKRQLWRALRTARVPPAVLAAGLVVALTMVSAGFLAPYGPWNPLTDANFQLSALEEANPTLYHELVKLASFVPQSDPWVLAQDNMPELFPRAFVPGTLGPMVPGPFDRVAYNLTWLAPNGTWSPLDPDYVIANPTPSPFNYFALPGTYPYNTSMEQVVTELYASYNYGIVGEASGMLLLEHHYSGPLRYYVPFSADFPSSAFSSAIGHVSDACGETCLVVRGQTDQGEAWSGPWFFLSPGIYSVSAHIGLADWTPHDRVLVQITGEDDGVVLNSTTLSGLSIGPQMDSLYLNSTLFVGDGIPRVEFRAVGSDFNGSLALYGVQVQEVAPPPTVYRVGDTAHDQAVYQLLSLVPSGSTVLAAAALRPYFHNLTLVTVAPNGTVPSAPYELYDPTIPPSCSPSTVSTMCENGTVPDLYSTYNYGVVGEVDGELLLKQYYTGPIQLYEPMSSAYSPSAFFSDAGVSDPPLCGSACLVATGLTGGEVAWYGPYTSLGPGTYSVSIHVGIANWTAGDQALLQVTGDYGNLVLDSTLLSGLTAGPAMVSRYVNSTVYSGNSTSMVEFRAVGSDFNGSLALYGVQVQEVAPPPTVYRVGDTAHDQAVYQLLSLVPSGSTVLAAAALRPYFHNLTLVTVAPNGTVPSAPYELYDPTLPSPCVSANMPTLCSQVNESYVSGAYSILAQEDGLSLLGQGHAELMVFSALELNISTSELGISGASGQNFTARSGADLTITNQTNDGVGWYGPYLSLSPGTYSLWLNLSVTNNGALNHIIIGVTTEGGRNWLNTEELNGTEFPELNQVVTVRLNFTLPNFADGVEFVGYSVDWPGVLTLSSVELVETASPPGWV